MLKSWSSCFQRELIRRYRLVPKSAFSSRMDNISADIKEAFYESLEQKKNDEIKARMVEEISSQIQNTLVKMAEVVEIPLG